MANPKDVTRASQIRVASEMNREIQREIKALKRDLRTASIKVELTVNPEQADKVYYKDITYKGMPRIIPGIEKEYKKIYRHYEKLEIEDRYGNEVKVDLSPYGVEPLYIGYHPRRDEFCVGQNFEGKVSSDSWEEYALEMDSRRYLPRPDGLPIHGYLIFKLDVDGVNITSTIKDVEGWGGEWLDYKYFEKRGYITVWKSEMTEWGGTDYN